MAESGKFMYLVRVGLGEDSSEEQRRKQYYEVWGSEQVDKVFVTTDYQEHALDLLMNKKDVEKLLETGQWVRVLQ